MATRNKLVRVDGDFARMIEEAMTERIRNGLDKRDKFKNSFREATRLFKTAPSFSASLWELKTIRRKHE